VSFLFSFIADKQEKKGGEEMKLAATETVIPAVQTGKSG
jgi:hypothetical protein